MISTNYPKSREIYSHTGLRGIAALSVFLYHIYLSKSVTWNLNYSFFRFFEWRTYAVDLFFVLSGFILYWVYFNKTEPIKWSSYLFARVARILPLYYLTFLVMLVLPVYSYVKYGSRFIGSGFLNKLFSNILMVSGLMGEKGNHTFNSPAWSISVEFFCYLFIFPLLYYIAKFISIKKYYLAVSILFTIIFTRLLIICYRFHEISIYGIEWDSSNLARGVFGFSVGFFLCAIYSKIANFRLSPIIADVIIITVILIYSLTSLNIIPAHLLLYTVPPLVLITAFDRGLTAGVLKMRALQWLGERSYSIYLWHMPVMGLLSLCLKISGIEGKLVGVINCFILIVLTLMVSEVSYRYFETPCRDLIRSLGKKPLATS